MSVHRRRPILYALIVVGAVWLLAWGGYSLSKQSKVTPEQVAAYLRATDLSRLSGEARAKALRELARQMCALSGEERRRARFHEEWEKWFSDMTDEEKGTFLEATLPSGFKQMLSSFEQLPEDKRKRAIEAALVDLRKAREAAEKDDPTLAQRSGRMGRAQDLSPELQQKVVTIGLKSFYSESSAQTKAELAPVIEEMQQLMESGRLFHGRH